MRAKRSAVSVPMLVAVVLVVVIVLGAGYYVMGQGGGGQSVRSSTSTTSSPSSTSTSPSSTSSSNSLNGRVIMDFPASSVLVSADVVANYSMTVATLGTVPSTLTLAVAAPTGIKVTLNPSQFTTGGNPTVPVASIQVGSSVSPGVYPVNVTATGGGETYSSALSLQVVKFLVVTVGTLFVPQNMTVPVNSTVYWMRLNGALSQYDNGQHNVVFLNGTLPSSPALQQWESYSYQFTEVGDYPYYCTFHPWQTGDIAVTP